MKSLLLVVLVLILGQAWGQSVDAQLLKECGNKELESCEKLGALYIGREEWEKAHMVGEALCEKEIPRGCLFAGSSLLAQGKVKEASVFLGKGCDGFEPLSCRSMGRLMEKAGEKAVANMYFKRSCHYGNKDICDDISPGRTYFSPPALQAIENIKRNCQNTRTEACLSEIRAIDSCVLPLNKLDCQLLAGHLSVYFRSRLIQEEAKASLLAIHNLQKTLKESHDSTGYSYDLGKVLKDFRPAVNYRYVFGFVQGCGKKYSKGKVKSVSKELYPGSYKDMGPRTTANVMSFFFSGKAEDCYDPKAGYEAYAVANLDPINLKRLDVWKIDQDGRIENIQDGLPLP